METFIIKYGRSIVVGVAALLIGAWLNNYISKQQNKGLLSDLENERAKLRDKEKILTLTIEEKKHLDTLNAEIYILKFKCK